MKSSAVKLYLPNFRWFYRGGHYDVRIDGRSVGEVWPKQVKVVDVDPGEHQIQLRFWPWMWTRKRVFSVAPGEAVELACGAGWTWLPGLNDLHLATTEEKEQMRGSLGNALPPRNLGSQPGSA